MYYKIINDRMVFSDCKTIQLDNGQWISNPDSTTIAAAGWLPYTPPPVVPIPQTEPDYDAILQAVKTMLASSTEDLSDEDALEVAALFPTWASKIGEQVTVGERLWYDGKLYKVIQSHIEQEDWKPDITTSLYVEVSIEEWPEWVQPTGAHDAYNTGDKVTFENKHYISLIDNNIWSPATYPAGWQEQS